MQQYTLGAGTSRLRAGGRRTLMVATAALVIGCLVTPSMAEFVLIPAAEMDGIESWSERSSYGAGNFFVNDGSTVRKTVAFEGGDYRIYIRTSTSPQTFAGLTIVVDGKPVPLPMQAKVSKYSWIRVATVHIPAGEVEIRVEPPTPGQASNDNFGAIAFASSRYDDRAGRTVEFFDWLRHELSRQEVPQPAPRDAAEARAHQQFLRRQVMDVLGLDPLPERTPLKPQVLGRIDKGDYVIEKIAFESRPNHVVAALLYLPKDTSTPVPAVISAIGHWSYGKSSKAPQLRGISLAKHGYAVLAIEGVFAWERRIDGNSESYEPLVAGGCIAGHEVWDLIRGADYLETRSDIDASKLAITGASGGGLQAMYAGAVDERFDAVMPAVALWHMAEIAINEIHSADNWVPDISRLGSMGMLAALTAPRPTLLLNVDSDYSTSYFLELMTNMARPYYRLLGTEDALWQTIEKGGHDYTKFMREASRGFLDHWLKGTGGGYPVPEPDIESELYPEEDPEILVFGGKGIPAEGAETVRSIWRAEAIALREALPDRIEGVADKVRTDLLRMPPLARSHALVEGDRMLLTTDPGIEVAVRIVGTGDRAVIWVGEQDIETELQRAEVKALASRARVYVLEPRGTGMRDALQILQQGPIVMGRPLAGMWAYDVMCLVDYLDRHESQQSITVAARGHEMGLVGLLATLLEPRIDRVALDGMFSSFVQVVGAGSPNIQIPAVLTVTDIAHMVREAGSSRILLNNLQSSRWGPSLSSSGDDAAQFFVRSIQ